MYCPVAHSNIVCLHQQAWAILAFVQRPLAASTGSPGIRTGSYRYNCRYQRHRQLCSSRCRSRTAAMMWIFWTCCFTAQMGRQPLSCSRSGTRQTGCPRRRQSNHRGRWGEQPHNLGRRCQPRMGLCGDHTDQLGFSRWGPASARTHARPFPRHHIRLNTNCLPTIRGMAHMIHARHERTK